MSRSFSQAPTNRKPRHLWRAERGVVLIWMSVATAMLLGLGDLVVDLGRQFNLHSQLVSYSDNVAQAAAAELDGTTGAIDRAIQAAVGAAPGPLVTDTQQFGLGAAELAVERLVFLSELGDDPHPDNMGVRPAGDVVLCSHQGGANDCVATDDAQARFVEVTVQPVDMSYFLVPVLAALGVDAATTGTTVAQAVAGFTRQVCNAPPLMICNPYEDPAGGGPFQELYGQQILLKSKGNGSQWAPGDFGLLDATYLDDNECSGGQTGANFIRCALGLVNPNTQCVEGTVDVRPGEAITVHVGLNTRFDLWDPPLQNQSGNPAFMPAANVTKGVVVGPQCRSAQQIQTMPEPPNNTVPLPKDACFASGTCDSGRFGNETEAERAANINAYWQTNHGVPAPQAFPARYDAYRYESENGLIPDKSAAGGEDGNPSCAPTGMVGDEFVDRRVLVVAIINCIEHGVQGSIDDVPVVAFARMFLTDAIGIEGASVDDVWVESLGLAQLGDESGILHDFPQLYR